MDSSREIEPPSGGEKSGSKGKKIDNTAEGEMDSSKQQATCKEKDDSNKQECSKNSDPNWQKKDNMAEDSRNPTFVVIDKPKTTFLKDAIDNFCLVWKLVGILRDSFSPRVKGGNN